MWGMMVWCCNNHYSLWPKKKVRVFNIGEWASKGYFPTPEGEDPWEFLPIYLFIRVERVLWRASNIVWSTQSPTEGLFMVSLLQDLGQDRTCSQRHAGKHASTEDVDVVRTVAYCHSYK